MKLIKDEIVKEIKDENLAKAMIQAGWEVKEEKKEKKTYERPLEDIIDKR